MLCRAAHGLEGWHVTPARALRANARLALAQANLLIPKECCESRLKSPEEPDEMVKPTLRTKSIGFKVTEQSSAPPIFSQVG